MKSVKKKFSNVIYFGIAIIVNSFFFASKLLYILLDIQAGMVVIPEIPFILSLVPGIIFIKKTFYADKNMPIVLLVWVIYAVSAIVSITSGFLEEFTRGDMAFKTARYIADDLVVYPVIFSWNIVNGIREYKRNLKSATRFVRSRFIYFALGHGSGIVSGFFDFLSGIVSPFFYSFYAPLSVFCAVFYGLFMYLTWFPPALLKKEKIDEIPGIAFLQNKSNFSEEMVGPEQVTGSVSNLAQKMQAIEYLGAILARHINKSPAACSGLILTCVEDQFGQGSVYRMDIKQIEAIISDILPRRLGMLGVSRVDEAIAALRSTLKNNLSLLTMMLF
ncbi:MAG: hypothetical protein Q6373_023105 [Candidatus Sigynarchaeota archaeon]